MSSGINDLRSVQELLTEANWIINALEAVPSDYRRLVIPALRSSFKIKLDSIIEQIKEKANRRDEYVEILKRLGRTELWIEGRTKTFPCLAFSVDYYHSDMTDFLWEESQKGETYYLSLLEFARLVQTLLEKISSGVYDNKLYEGPETLLLEEFGAVVRSRTSRKHPEKPN